MPSAFQDLQVAIIADDLGAVNVLLAQQPTLATTAVAQVEYFEPTISHHIYKGDTALHIAAAAYRLTLAEALLAVGADPGAASNRRASQPLHYAADGSPGRIPARQVAMIRLLLTAGAKINAQDKNGATPLHRAVRTRCAEAVQCLLAAGANPAIRNLPGSTAFHLAVQNTGRGGSGTSQAHQAQHAIIQAFLAHQISPTLSDAKGKTVPHGVAENAR